MPKLYLMLGYPGAGKTTTANLLQQLTHAVQLNSDEIRLELFPEPTFSQDEHDRLYQEIDRRTEVLLRDGQDVIYDANLNRLKHRQEKYHLCRQLGAEPVLLWIKTPRTIAKQRRIEEISHHRFVPQSETPTTMFDRLADIFEEPTADEPFVPLDGTKINQEYLRSVLPE